VAAENNQSSNTLAVLRLITEVAGFVKIRIDFRRNETRS
jgi:hypothetical protein